MTYKWCWSFKKVSFLVLYGLLSCCSQKAIADCGAGLCLIAQNQIVPDNTLGEESSTVIPEVIKGIESDRIEGGAQRGANLFHSFENFNVDEGRGAYFTNPAGIENILSRVTGVNPSEILGTLGVLGDANLFLINPNGVIFGPNASLDVGGAFIVTTANGVGLGETGLFSATEPETSNLLAIRPSALFFNAVNRQTIVNKSRLGLQVPSDRTLAIVGGDVILHGGNLTAEGGRIELGSVFEGEVNLSQSENNWIFEYDKINTFGNIRLQNEAIVDVSGSGGGDVQIQGARFEIRGSFLFADTLGSEDGGVILIRTTEAVTFSDSSVLTSSVFGLGAGVDLRIETGQLTMQDGSQIGTFTLGVGDGGSLTVKATESVQLIGESADGQFLSSLFTDTAQGVGVAGNLTLETRQLTVQDGAVISATTFGAGDGGSLTVKATESVQLIGESKLADRQFPSGLFAETQGDGNSGDLTLETKQLTVEDGALISATTFGEGKAGSLTIKATELVKLIGSQDNDGFPSGLFARTQGSGNAGNLTLETRQLIVQDGALISATTFGEGKAGSLTIKATELVELIGEGESTEDQFNSGLYTRSESGGTAGNLTIETEQLIIKNGAEITARSEGTGNAGNIIIDVLNILEAEDGNITTTALQSTGGAINITAGDFLLRGDSDISTNVFQGAGGGGNITLKADSIIAFDDSDILAFSLEGQGGNITLDTPVFLGENFRQDSSGVDPNILNNNDRVDINASGATSGVITLPDVSFIQNSLTELPENPIDTTSLLATSCIVPGDRPQNSFTITGSGGLQSRPEDAFVSPFPLGTIQTIPPESEPNSSAGNEWQEGDAIVEPTGVYRLPNGQLIISRECS